MDPNSQNQRWSRWAFVVHDAGRLVPREDVKANVSRWLRIGFGSAGKARIQRTRDGWRIEAVVEGADAHDPAYVANVRQQFQRNFVEKGWGPAAWSEVSAGLLAGSAQDGKPPAQWVEMPSIRVI